MLLPLHAALLSLHPGSTACCCCCCRRRCQLLQLSFAESSLSQEQLLLLVVNEDSSRVLVKGAVPLAGLVPGQPYSLALALTDACVVWVTLLLGLGAKTQLEVLQGAGLAAAGYTDGLRLLQVQLADAGAALQGVADRPGELWAVWRGSGAGRPGSSSSRQQVLHTPVDGREGSESAAAAAVRSINGSCGLLSAAAGGSGAEGAVACSVLAALPVHSTQRQDAAAAGEQLWPPNQMLLLPYHPASAVAATLELHLQTYGPAISSSSSSVVQPSKRVGWLELASSALVPLRSGRPCLLKGQQLLLAGGAGSAAATAVPVSLEVVMWDLPSYVEHLMHMGAAAAVPAQPGVQGG